MVSYTVTVWDDLDFHFLTSLSLTLDIPCVLLLNHSFLEQFLVKLADNTSFNETHELKSSTLMLKVAHLLHKSHFYIYLLLPLLLKLILIKEPHLNFTKSIKKFLFLLKLIQVPSVVLDVFRDLRSLIDEVIIYREVFWVLNLHSVHTFDEVEPRVLLASDVVLSL